MIMIRAWFLHAQAPPGWTPESWARARGTIVWYAHGVPRPFGLVLARHGLLPPRRRRAPIGRAEAGSFYHRRAPRGWKPLAWNRARSTALWFLTGVRLWPGSDLDDLIEVCRMQRRAVDRALARQQGGPHSAPNE